MHCFADRSLSSNRSIGSRVVFFFLLSFCMFSLPLPDGYAKEPDNVRLIVEKAFDYWRGMSSVSKFSMQISRPDFKREMVMKGWTKDRDKALFFVEAPPKDYGNGSLKKGREMWSYNPKINRVVKIPPSMMGQSWMGSDFSNDDLAKSDTILDDYSHSLIKEEKIDGIMVYTIESVAKDDAPVVWGKQVLVIREDMIMLKETFFDEEMIPVKEMVAEQIEMIGGRLFPRVWTMHRLDEEDRFTRLEYLELSFDDEIDDRMFSINSLKTKKR